MKKPIIHQPCDKLFKESLVDKRVAKQFFEAHLPKQLLEKIDLATLKLENNSFIDDQYKATQADIVYAVSCESNTLYIQILCEHQSKVDRYMSLRLLKYTVRIMEAHIKKYPKSKHLPLVYPLVLYAGHPVWEEPRDVFALLGSQEALGRELLLKPFQLIDIQRISDEELQRHPWSGLMEFALKNQVTRDTATYLNTLLPWLDEIDRQLGTNYAKLVLKFVSHYVDGPDKELFAEQVEAHLTHELKGEAMTLAEAFRQEGREEGMEKGIQKGRQEGREEGVSVVAARLLAEGFPLEKISQLTGMSYQQVVALEKEKH